VNPESAIANNNFPTHEQTRRKPEARLLPNADFESTTPPESPRLQRSFSEPNACLPNRIIHLLGQIGRYSPGFACSLTPGMAPVGAPNRAGDLPQKLLLD
jgi:hypothetical protein